MKRLVVVLSSLLVLPAFAEVSPSQIDTENMFSGVEFDDATTGAVEEIVADKEVSVPVAKPQTSTSGRMVGTGTAGRVAAGRSGISRASNVASPRTNSVRSRSVSVRSATTPVRTTSVTTRRADNIGTTQRQGVAARASTLNSTQTVYNPNATSGVRASVTSRGMRAATIVPATTTTVPTAESAVETMAELNAIKSLTEYCQAQYASCMDNYCNVLDDNQGRCTCSKNIASYEKTEAALANATAELENIGRSINYIGLSADQISTLFAETEAELSMGNAKDNSALHSSLDKVKRMIVDIKSGSASSTSTGSGVNFDMDGLLNFDFSEAASGFNMASFMKTSSNTGSISNQRGESLYKTASARCKASVLNSCTAQGVDAAVVTNSYDLEIDKSCLAYERALTESNAQMTQTVANAKEFLKRARLAVAVSKNEYNLRECVSALESCMQDDYVCGNDYENCLDPTGQFIVNGSVVIGSMPGNNTNTENVDEISSNYSHDNLFSTWDVSDSDKRNPWYTADGYTATSSSSGTPAYITLVDYIDATVTGSAAKSASDKMSAYLQNKIGYHDNSSNKDYGMCASVLNKCQDYTYKKGKYEPTNEVIKQFLQRALVRIKSAQDTLLTSYATSCIEDVQSCLNTNKYDSANPESTKSRTAVNSCYSQIKTCMSVNGNIYGSVTPTVLQNWVTGNYTSLEIYRNTTNITYTCEAITDEAECKAVRGYCDNESSISPLNNGGSICTWAWTDSSDHSKGGTCSGNASCN